MTPQFPHISGARAPGLLLLLFLAACSDDPEKLPPPQIIRFEASKIDVARGEVVSLSWEVTGASSLGIDDDLGRALLPATDRLTGSIETPPIERTSTFVLTAVGADGQTDYQAVTLRIAEPHLEILRFAAEPNPAALTGRTQLTWQVQGATGLELWRGDQRLDTVPTSSLTSGSTTSPPLLTPSTAFTLVATDGVETVRAELSVAASPRPAIRTFRVSPRVFTGTSTQVTIAWTTENAAALELTANGARVPELGPITTGTLALTISETTTFELAASGLGVEVRARESSARPSSEVEPNDSRATATPMGAAVSGTLVADDLDVFAIAVPEGGSVFAELSDGRGACPFEGLLTLYAPNGQELGRSTLGGGGTGGGGGMGGGLRCARIDPRRAAFATNLPAGTYTLALESPPNEVGAYVVFAVASVPRCGNAILEAAEGCDEGFGPTNGLCTPSCERVVQSTIAPPGGERTLSVPAGMAALVEVVLTRDGQSIEARASDAAGACTIESRLTLTNADFERIVSRTSDVVSGACAAFEFPAFDYFTDLPAGTYYLDLENETNAPAAMRLSVTVHEPACGNGAVELSQGEQCDEGDLVGGDGCDGQCQFESVAALTGPPADMTYSGSILPADQIDFYAVTLSAPGYITAETFIPTAGACTSTTSDTILELFPADFSRLIASADGSYPAPCERIAPAGASDLLPAGGYRVGVRAFGGRIPVPSYAVRIQVTAPSCGNGFLEAGETCDDGNVVDGDACPASCEFPGTFTREVEPNGTSATATPSGATTATTTVVLGALEPLGDIDVFAIDVVGGPVDLVAVTHTSPADPDVCAGIDTRLALQDVQGNVLASNDDGGAGACSLISGDAYPQVLGLAPGRYYLEVRPYDGRATVPVYFLSVRFD